MVDVQGNTRQKVIFQVIPNLILWFLWKRRNIVLHGGNYTTSKVIWDINSTVQKFMKLKFQYTDVPSTWPQMVALLDVFRPRFVSKWVKSHPPPSGWLKCNTDGASRGNPGPSAAAFCIRNHEGELVIAKGVRIPDSTDLVAEAIAIREGLQCCLENNFPNIIIETDSLALVHMLKGEWEIPWNVTMEVNSINRLRNSMYI
ncbi:hypothetical protein KY289_024168 [Solanum tuberosum]|nr:hypothetical protein KY289_024168 [Solanum tuberosum]